VSNGGAQASDGQGDAAEGQSRWIRSETRELPEVRRLMVQGRRRGYLTLDDVTEVLSLDDDGAEFIAEVRAIANEHGIRVVSADKRPAAARRGARRAADDAPTNDPVRVYLREMGQVSLLPSASRRASTRRSARFSAPPSASAR
jgi:hypothetical protein